MSFNIAIDGPAGAGKSSVAKAAAERLHFIYVDTGAMYRTLALAVLRDGIDAADDASLKKVLDNVQVEIAYIDGAQHMLLNGEDVTGLIRTPEVSSMTSQISTIPAVRARLLQMQRDMAKASDVLMDGRDIGTVILPDAQLKIFLTASVEERAKRRYTEMIHKGQACDLEEIRTQIAERDQRDMNRETAPLRQAEDAVLLDTSNMTIEEAIDAVVQLAETRMKAT